MSGIVGSKFNIRGSGLVGSLGTDGQHMLSAGAGKTNVFETVAGGADLVKISNHSTTSADALSFDVLDSTYDDYLIQIWRCIPDSTGQSLNMRLRTDGSDIDSSNYSIAIYYNRTDITPFNDIVAAGGFAHTDHWQVTEGNFDIRTNHQTYNKGAQGFIHIMTPSNATYACKAHSKMFYTGSTELLATVTHMHFDLATAPTGFTLYPSSGAFDDMNFTVYGLKP